ncbi:YceI family protein [Winogradskyella alexanderae]|uniref:YceI family protein n=1 Tax=Winogradskyella alexanderae TaxID=2877123 RepID=A0ABS7XQK4_9FLAO|nr:YceI family protein [Winogradskyella alexanderae]MCA0132289.1 YceI family protein [Winogradskyella alexanderae]
MLQLPPLKRLLRFIIYSILFSFQFLLSQTYNLNNDTSFLEVHGTSSLHDWHVDAQSQYGDANISFENVLEIKTLNFSVISESLKSGKSGMDKNTYKALKTDSYNKIDFNLKSVEATKRINENHYKIYALGDLTICGVTKSVPIEFSMRVEDNQLLIEGEKPLLMTDYGIEPPKALFGTIKTGNEINVVFKAVYETKK